MNTATVVSRFFPNLFQTMSNQTPELPSIEEILRERGNRYGRFVDHAAVTQRLKTVMHLSDRWCELENDQKEALEMVAHKIGRILNGDPNYLDSWVDIVGYTQLVVDRLKGDPK
jgi:hypothetical protein